MNVNGGQRHQNCCKVYVSRDRLTTACYGQELEKRAQMDILGFYMDRQPIRGTLRPPTLQGRQKRWNWPIGRLSWPPPHRVENLRAEASTTSVSINVVYRPVPFHHHVGQGLTAYFCASLYLSGLSFRVMRRGVLSGLVSVLGVVTTRDLTALM